MQSPVARGFARLVAVHEAADACNAATWSVSQTLSMLNAANEYAEIHAGTPLDDLREYMDSYLESCFPDVSDELREQVVMRACRGAA
jgi:hypothetical protein